MAIRNKYLLNWPEAMAAGADSAGGKGYNLGRLAVFGFNVPEGMVLNSSAYQEFITYNGLASDMERISSSISSENLDQNTSVLKELCTQIASGKLPVKIEQELDSALAASGLAGKSLAVRSSATMEDGARFSFAGIHESFLNVCGREQLHQAIKECYASLWLPKALAYRRRFELKDEEVLPAVVIMEMVQTRAAGVAFTCDPQTGRRDRVVIHASFGLGDALVNGALDPDSYNLDPSPFYSLPRIVDRRVGRKERLSMPEPGGGVSLQEERFSSNIEALTDHEVVQLGKTVLRIFESLGESEQHQDIEWAYDGKEFFMLQARPATAIPRYTFEAMKNRIDIWSNGNYRDAAPMVFSPIQRRIMKHIVDIIQYTSFADIGYQIPEGFQFSRFFQGRLYCDTSAYLWANYDCSGALPAIFTPFWGGHHPDLEIAEACNPSEDQARAWQERGARAFAVISEKALQAESCFAEVGSTADAIMALEWESLPDGDFERVFNEIGQNVEGFSLQYTWFSGVNGMAFIALMQHLYGYFGEGTMTVINGLMAGSSTATTSAEHGYRLLELAEIASRDTDVAAIIRSQDFDPRAWEQSLPEGSAFKDDFRGFIREFGHRAVYELDIINPRWQEDPSYMFDFIKSAMGGPGLAQLQGMQAEKFGRSWQEASGRLPENEMPALKELINRAREGAVVREATKSVLVKALECYRRMALEMGRRLCERGILSDINAVFFCTWVDLLALFGGEWDGKGLEDLVAFRKVSHSANQAIPAPDFIRGEERVFSHELQPFTGEMLRGLGSSAGRAEGRACLIANPAQGGRMQRGEVLVAPSTDPGWTPLFLKAAALIMETGGYLSHGSIVAREYGIPAVINVPGAMHHLKNGLNVQVDGDEGKIYISGAVAGEMAG